MKRVDFQASLAATFQDCLAISNRKNADYADDSDPFKNFRVCEALGIPAEVGILVRMTDKMSRISTLMQPGREPQVKDESLKDTLRDLANYSAIFIALLESNEAEKQ